MFTAKNYVKVNNIEEAFELNKSRNNVVMGGLMWLKQSTKNINTLIDLSALNLNKIEEIEDAIEIGAMISLRTLEKSHILKMYFGNYFSDALKSIVGVQFRNGATLGGSVYGRYGFSDVITALMPLDAKVVIFDGEEKTLSLTKYASLKKDNSIVTKVILPKTSVLTDYKSMRIVSTDFPLLTIAISLHSSINSENAANLFVAIGARPNVATLIESENFDISELSTSYAQDVNNNSLSNLTQFAEKYIFGNLQSISFGSNLKASAEYRQILAKSLIVKALFEIAQKGQDSWK